MSATSARSSSSRASRRGRVARQLVVQRAAPTASSRQARRASRTVLGRARERVEHRELVARPREPPLLELAAHREQALDRGGDVLARGAAPPRVGARAPVGEDPPRDDERLLALGPQLRERAERVVVGQVELRLDVRLAAGRADRRRVAARAEQQADRVREDRLARAGLAGDRVQARRRSSSSASRMRTRFSMRSRRSTRSIVRRRPTASTVPPFGHARLGHGRQAPARVGPSRRPRRRRTAEVTRVARLSTARSTTVRARRGVRRAEDVAVAAEERLLGQRRELAPRRAEAHARLRAGGSSPTGWPSTSTTASMSGERFVTTRSVSRPTTSGRACSECGATNVTTIASSPHTSTGPAVREVVRGRAGRRRADQAVARLHAEPLAADRPLELDHAPGRAARDDGVVDRGAASRRSSVDLERRQLDHAVVAGEDAREARLELVACDRRQEPDAAEVDAEHRARRVPRKRVSARSIVPSPPSTTARSASAVRRRLDAVARGLVLVEEQLDAGGSAAARRRVDAPGRRRASRPCVTTAARSTGGIGDPAVELGGELGLLCVDEVEDELMVSLGPGQARVYDPGHSRRPRRATPRRPRAARAAAPPGRARRPSARRPGPASNCGLTSTSACQPGAASASAGGSAVCTEMNETSQVTSCGANGSSVEVARVRPLEHGHARVVAEPLVQLPVADVERDHPRARRAGAARR